MTEEGAVFRAPFSFPVREKKETILEKKRSYPFLVLLAAALLLGLFSREREPLEKGKEPVVLPGKM